MFLKKLLIPLFSLILLFVFNPINAKNHQAGEKIEPSWMVVDSGNKLVTFTLTSAYNGNNGSWNYNGFYNGSANLVVPQGWNVNLKFVFLSFTCRLFFAFKLKVAKQKKTTKKFFFFF